MSEKRFITSESVTEGHPDKICDQISDAILDELIAQDPSSRVAVECLTTTGLIMVAGEVTTAGFADVQKIARRTLREIGYTNPFFGIDADDCGVLVSIHGQSSDIAQGVNESKSHEQGAGDQGMMYGFATNETPELMPAPIMYAHKLAKKLAEVRKKGLIPHLGPDGKTQVTFEYENGKPKRIDTVVIAQQHLPELDEQKLKKMVMEQVIIPICGDYLDNKTTFHINATGVFIVGGPEADTGVTGRKIMVDTYGGVGRHGGGAFSGKDPSKVDRSAAYAARYIAKNIVAAGIAQKCEVQLSYAIGVADPVSINVDCSGTNKISEDDITKLVRKHFSLKPGEIVKMLDLKRPIYKNTAAYGHFGRDGIKFFWERTDKAEALKADAGL